MNIDKGFFLRVELRRALRIVTIFALTSGVSACVVRAEPPVVGGYATVYADDELPASVDVDLYPHVWFEGGYAYYVNDRWYYRSGERWVRLRREPPALARYRATYVQHAPPARGHAYERRRQASPNYGYPHPAGHGR
jgi:hypothetical protein